MMRMITQLLRQERGQSLVEMALVATLLISLTGGVVDFGSAFHHYIIITNAAREGVRMGARIPCQSAKLSTFTNAVKQAAIDEAASSGITLATGNVSILPVTCPATGAELTVTVDFAYTPMMGSFIGVGTFSISNSVRMVFAGNDQE